MGDKVIGGLVEILWQMYFFIGFWYPRGRGHTYYREFLGFVCELGDFGQNGADFGCFLLFLVRYRAFC
jgi:hypothetical protein